MAENAAGTGFWSAQKRNDARQGRALLQSVFLGGSSNAPMSASRSGVVATAGDREQCHDLRVQVSAGRTMTVNPGTAVVNRPGQGPYEGWLLPPAASVTCDPEPVSDPRHDLVVMRVYDAELGDTVPAEGPCAIEVITGQPGPTPADPVVEDRTGAVTDWSTAPVEAQAAGGGVGLVLARAAVATDGTVTVTDLRRSTAPVGSMRMLLPGDSPSDPGHVPGELSWFGGPRVWDGATWRGMAARPYVSEPIAAVVTNQFPYVLASVAVPDPGWPYRLAFAGTVNMSSGVTGGFDIIPRDGSPFGPGLTSATVVYPNDGRRGGDRSVSYAVSGSSTVVLYGARTVFLVVHRWSGEDWIGIDGNPQSRLAVTVVPA